LVFDKHPVTAIVVRWYKVEMKEGKMASKYMLVKRRRKGRYSKGETSTRRTFYPTKFIYIVNLLEGQTRTEYLPEFAARGEQYGQ
jgi:hypothetical protein